MTVSFKYLLALVITALPLALLAISFFRNGTARELAENLKRVPRNIRIAILALVLPAIIYAVDKPVGEGTNRMMRTLPRLVSRLVSHIFSPMEQAVGYAVTAVNSNEVHDFTMPEGAHLADRIAKRGAHEDGYWQKFAETTNTLVRAGFVNESSMWVDTQASITLKRPYPGISIQELALYETFTNITVYAAVEGDLSFLPGSKWHDYHISRIWTADTSRNTKVITYEGACWNRDASIPVSVQQEFYPNGDVKFRYEGLPENDLTGGIFRNGSALTFGIGTNTTSVSLAYIGDLTDGSGDTDEDGLTDWEEIMLYHTDPNCADTDGDGLSDGEDSAPLDWDADNDGIPDGFSPPEWNSNPGFGSVAGNTNVVISVICGMQVNTQDLALPSGMSSGEHQSAVLNICGMSLPAVQGASYELYLPEGEYIPYRLCNIGSVPVQLSISAAGDRGLWIDKPDVFSGGTVRGNVSGRLAVPLLSLVAVGEYTGSCVHETLGYRDFLPVLSPMAWGLATGTISGFTQTGSGTLRLNVGDSPTSVATGTVELNVPWLKSGHVEASATIHRCEYQDNDECGYCWICGYDPEDHDTTGLNIEIEKDRYLVSCNSESGVCIQLSSESDSPANWEIIPQSENGPKIYTSQESASGSFEASGLSSINIKGGSTSGTYTIIAKHPEHPDVSDSATLSVIKITFEPVTTELDGNDRIVNPVCCVLGSPARFKLQIEPSGAIPSDDMTWQTDVPNAVTISSPHSTDTYVTATRTGVNGLTFNIDDLDGPSPYIKFIGVTENVIDVYAWIVGNDDGSGYAQTEANVNTLFTKINKIYKQAGMRFVIRNVAQINNADYLELPRLGSTYQNATEICNITNNTGGLEFYFVNTIGNGSVAAINVSRNGNSTGIIASTDASALDIAHEIGHSCKLRDIYNSYSNVQEHVEGPVSKDRMPDDWGSKSNSGFYPTGMTQSELITRLLMYGVSISDIGDITFGDIYGLSYYTTGYGRYWFTNLISVGINTVGERQPVHY